MRFFWLLLALLLSTTLMFSGCTSGKTKPKKCGEDWYMGY